MTFPLLELATNGCNIGNILGCDWWLEKASHSCSSLSICHYLLQPPRMLAGMLKLEKITKSVKIGGIVLSAIAKAATCGLFAWEAQEWAK